MSELISKIDAKSGDRLSFPSNQPISPKTKQLLIKLLQKDPDRRISFVDFFRAVGLDIPEQESTNLNSQMPETFSCESESTLKKSQISDFRSVKELQAKVLHPLIAKKELGRDADTPMGSLKALSSFNSIESFSESMSRIHSFSQITNDSKTWFVISTNEKNESDSLLQLPMHS